MPSLIRFIDYFIPGHALAIMTLVLYSVPKQVYYQLRISSKDNNQVFWEHLINETESTMRISLPKLSEEISVLRFHMGIQSEYCHISNYQASMHAVEHQFYQGPNRRIANL